jgi:hypothetical protein
MSFGLKELTYGAETWMWTKADISRLMAAKTNFFKMYRRNSQKRQKKKQTNQREFEDKHLGK